MSPIIKMVDVEAELLNETEKAFLVNEGSRSVWLPKSIAEDNGDGTFTIPEWLAQDLEMI